MTTSGYAYQETDSYLSIRKQSAAYGGAQISSFAEDAATAQVLQFDAHGGTANTTKSTSGVGLINFRAVEHNGSNTAANVTADGNVFSVQAQVGGAMVTRWLLDEDGDTWQSGGATIGGNLFIGDTANGNMTVGLTINQGTADDSIMAFKSSDVGHVMTGVAEADTFGSITKAQATSGGLVLNGYKDTAGIAGAALQLSGSLGEAADTTDTSASTAVVNLIAKVTNGSTSIASVADAGNAVSFANGGGTTRWLIKGNGAVHQTTDAHTALDDYPDALMARVGRAEMAPKDTWLSENFAGIVGGAKDFLADHKIMWKDPYIESNWMHAQNATLLAWDMAFQNAQWLADIVTVLTDDQRDRLPTKTRNMLALMPAGE